MKFAGNLVHYLGCGSGPGPGCIQLSRLDPVPWVSDSVPVKVTDNLFKKELQPRKSPALPPSCPDYYADLFRAPLHEVF
jgi:hypothetical protein